MKTIPSSVPTLPHWVQIPVQKSPVYKIYGKYYHANVFPVIHKRPSGNDPDFFRDVKSRPQTLWMNLADGKDVSSSAYPTEFSEISGCLPGYTESFTVDTNAIDIFRNLLAFELHGAHPQRTTFYIENPDTIGNMIKMTTEYPHGDMFSEKQFQIPFRGRSAFYQVYMDTIHKSVIYYSLTPVDKEKTIFHLDVHVDRGKIPSLMSRLRHRIDSTVRLKDTFSDTYSMVLESYLPDVVKYYRSITHQ